MHQNLFFPILHTCRHELHGIFMGTHILVQSQTIICNISKFNTTVSTTITDKDWVVQLYHLTYSCTYTHYIANRIATTIWLLDNNVSHSWFRMPSLYHLSSHQVSNMTTNFKPIFPYQSHRPQHPWFPITHQLHPFTIGPAYTAIDCYHNPTHIMVFRSREVQSILLKPCYPGHFTSFNTPSKFYDFRDNPLLLPDSHRRQHHSLGVYVLHLDE